MGKLRERVMFFICIYDNLQSTFEQGTCLHLHIWTFRYSTCLRFDPLLWVTWPLWINSKNSLSYSLHYIWFQSRQVSAAKSFVMPRIVQRMSLPKNNSSVTLPIHKVSHVWVSFHHLKSIFFSIFYVTDVGIIMALLWQVYSCRLQLIIQELDLET